MLNEWILSVSWWFSNSTSHYVLLLLSNHVSVKSALWSSSPGHSLERSSACLACPQPWLYPLDFQFRHILSCSGIFKHSHISQEINLKSLAQFSTTWFQTLFQYYLSTLFIPWSSNGRSLMYPEHITFFYFLSCNPSAVLNSSATCVLNCYIYVNLTLLN